MKLKAIIIGLSACLALSSCQSVNTPFAQPAVDVPGSYEQNLSLADNAVIASEWWTTYQDTQLNQLMAKALENNTDVLAAVARIESAEAELTIAGASRLPTLDLSGGATRSRVTEAGAFPAFGPNPRENYQLTLDSAIELDLWGKLSQVSKQAQASLLSTQYAKEAVMWSLSSLVASQYITLSSLDAQLVVNQKNQTVANKSLSLAQKRLAGGVASKLDVLQAQSQLDDLRTQAISLKRLRGLSLHQLQLLIGDLTLSVETPDILLQQHSPLPPAGLPSELMANRPDIKQAEMLMQANHANIAIAKAALYPSISLTGQFGGQSLELGDILKSAARIWSLGISLNLPIFNGGALEAKVTQANAKQKELLANYIAAIRTAFTEVNDALLNTKSYRETETLSAQKEKRAASMLAIANNRYREGYSSYLDVLDAQRNYHAETLAFVQARQNVLLASVDLFKAIGNGWRPLETTKP